MIREENILLPDGNSVDYEMFWKLFEMLRVRFEAYWTSTQKLQAMQEQAKRCEYKILHSDTPEGFWGKKKKMKEQQKEYAEKLFDLQLEIQKHYSENVEFATKGYQELMPLLLPQVYCHPEAVQFVCYVITEKKVKNLKEALNLYHKYLRQQEIEDAYARGRQLQNQHECYVTRMERSMANLQREINSCMRQSEYNVEEARKHMSSAWCNEVLQGKTPTFWV